MTIHSAAPARLFPWARNRAKRVLVRSDMWRHRRDPAIRGWKPVLAGARVGHIVVPSKALTTSRAEAADFFANGLIAGNDRVLDVGAGNGRQAIGLLEAGIRDYVGLDVVRGSVDWANQAFHSMNLPARFHLLDVVNGMYNPAGTITPTQVTFPYGDAEFDCVLAGSLYTHLESMDVVRLYIAETARVLRCGGGAFMSFFRSPPNSATSSAVRTVYPHEEIMDAVCTHFTVRHTCGGDTTALHDQWRLYLRRRD